MQPHMLSFHWEQLTKDAGAQKQALCGHRPSGLGGKAKVSISRIQRFIYVFKTCVNRQYDEAQ